MRAWGRGKPTTLDLNSVTAFSAGQRNFHFIQIARSRARSSAVAFAADAYVLDFWFVSLARLVPRSPLPRPSLCLPLDAAGSSSLVARYVTNEHPSERR